MKLLEGLRDEIEDEKYGNRNSDKIYENENYYNESNDHRENDDNMLSFSRKRDRDGDRDCDDRRHDRRNRDYDYDSYMPEGWDKVSHLFKGRSGYYRAKKVINFINNLVDQDDDHDLF